VNIKTGSEYELLKPLDAQPSASWTEKNLLLESGDSADRLCGLLVRVPGYGFRGPDSILGTTRFSEK
jgi:hypothetical protein